MAIQNDFTIYPATKVVRHTANNNVYQVSAFYSWLMNTFDEPGYLTYPTPMKYSTPTSYTMLNGWFLDNGDGSNILQYLTGGSILTSGYGTASDPIRMVELDNGGTNYVDCVAGDKDKPVTADGTTIGPLLAYKNDYPTDGTTGRWWIRDSRGTPAALEDNDIMDVTGGTGGGDSVGVDDSGDEIYCNIYTIASFPGSPNPQVYIYQNHPVSGTPVRISEWSAFTNWDRGSIDVLIPVQLGGDLINSGLVDAFVRQSGDSFTYVNADLSSGARTPIATETARDEVNITKGEHYLLYDAEAGGGFAVGDVIQNVATNSGTVPSWYAEVVSNNDYGSEGCLTLRGLRGTITNNADIYVSTTIRGVANGTPGDTYGTWDGEVGSPIAGDLGKILIGGTTGAKRILRGFQDDGTTGKYVCDANHAAGVTGDSRNTYYRAFNATEAISAVGDGGTMNVTSNLASTTLISGYSDITIGHINGTVAAGTFSGDFIIGEKVTWDAGASSGILVKTNNSTSLTLANVTSPDTITGDTITGQSSAKTCVASGNLVDANTATFAFTQQALFTYTTFIEGGSIYEGGRSLSDIYAYLQFICRDGNTDDFYISNGATITTTDKQAYLRADSTHAISKVAPFGTLAGVVFFGAQGVWIQGMSSSDTNNIKLTDHTTNARQPYASINIIVSNTRQYDTIAVYLEDGATTLPDKNTYWSHNSENIQGDSLFTMISGDAPINFPIDTPSDGAFIAVDTSANEEHRYRYASWLGSGLTLVTAHSGIGVTGTSGTILVDESALFYTWGIKRGDIIRNVTYSGWGYVTNTPTAASGDEVAITTTQLTTATKMWAVSDNYELNTLVVTYTSSDTFFVPYVDDREVTGTDASPGSVTVNILYDVDRPVVIVARDVIDTSGYTPIQPFKTTSDITSAGMNVSVIRTEDEVYSS